MKNTLIIILILVLKNYSFAQKSYNNDTGTIYFCKGSVPIYVLNGKKISTEFFEKELKKEIGAIVIEGDSVYMKSRGNKESILKKYFGDEVKRGVLLMFTPELVSTLNGRSMKEFLKKTRHSTLWNVQDLNSSLTSDVGRIKAIGVKNITRIELIKHIGFQNIDGSNDFFNIAIVYLKKDFLFKFYNKVD